MEKILVVLLACVESAVGQPMPAIVALEGNTKTLQERYYLMKIKSETYQDYKVIKESIMDAVWNIVNDSLAKRERQLGEANNKMKALENTLAQVRTKLKSQEDSMEGIVFASTHINVLGVNFGKVIFLILCALTSLILLSVIFLLLLRLKSMQVFVKESKLIVASTTHEFEDYKRKAFEKQTKLNRELQTERNKLIELKESKRMA